MTKVDIKNYLEQIYKIPVVNVMTFNKLGHITMATPSSKNAAPPMPDNLRKAQRLNKEEDDKIAQVSVISKIGWTQRMHLIPCTELKADSLYHSKPKFQKYQYTSEPAF